MKINTKDVEEIVARFKAGNSHFRVSVLVFNATFSNISVCFLFFVFCLRSKQVSM
jgi:hypothetical protein